MSFDYWALATALAALWAGVWNIMAAYRLGGSPWRKVREITAIFSFFYAGAFGWLLVFPHQDRALWSEVLTPVSFSSFLVVWAGPAMMAYFRNDPAVRHRSRHQEES